MAVSASQTPLDLAFPHQKGVRPGKHNSLAAGLVIIDDTTVFTEPVSVLKLSESLPCCLKVLTLMKYCVL